MASSCVGKGCTLLIEDAKTKRAFKPVSSANLKWLRDMFISEGINRSSLLSPESKICLNAFKSYRRQKDNLENQDDCEYRDPKRVALPDNTAVDDAA